jgi:hypothetical protein
MEAGKSADYLRGGMECGKGGLNFTNHGVDGGGVVPFCKTEGSAR